MVTIYDPEEINTNVLEQAVNIKSSANNIQLCIATGNRNYEFWNSLNNLLDIDSELELKLATKLFSDRNGWGDLSFLKLIPRLKRLSINDEVDHLENLQYLEHLNQIGITDQKTKKSLLPILKFKEELEILIISNKLTELECIGNLIKLIHINILGSIKLDISVLKSMSELKAIWMFRKIQLSNENDFIYLNNLKDVRFYNTQIEDYRFLENIINLNNLVIDSPSKIVQLPQIDIFKNLETIMVKSKNINIEK
jgi:hypothetical protein